MSGGLQRRRSQGVAQIRLMEPDDANPCRCRVVAQPPEGNLVGRGEHDQGIGGNVPVADDIGVGNGEVERRMCHLTRLDPGGQIITGDQVEAGVATLTVWHAVEYTCLRRSGPLVRAGLPLTRPPSGPCRGVATVRPPVAPGSTAGDRTGRVIPAPWDSLHAEYGHLGPGGGV